MDQKRIDYLLNTPREQLNRQERRLQTVIKKYGSVSAMLSKRDVGDLVLGGFNGGRKRVKKGLATWEEGKLSAFTKARPRYADGRFIPKKYWKETDSNPEAER